MKKLLLLLLVITLCLPLFASLAIADETYPKDSYTLVETSINLSGLPIYIQSHALESLGLEPIPGKEGLVQIGVYEDFSKDYTFSLCYASKNMETLVFTMEGKAIVCLRNGKLIFCVPNANRGAGDPNDTLKYYSKNTSFLNLSTNNGLIFSADGRYIAYVDQHGPERYSYYHLLLFDIEDGEYFYGQTWDTQTKPGQKSNYAIVVNAAFDSTGNYLYYITVGNQNEYTYSLYRYTLATSENKLLVNHKINAPYPNLITMSPFKLIAPAASRFSGDKYDIGIMVYTRKLFGEWKAEYHIISTLPYSIKRLQASVESGFALATLYCRPRNEDFSRNVLVLINARNELTGLTHFLLFNDDISACNLIPLDTFISEYSYVNREAAETMPYLLNACLTPDGKNALILQRLQPSRDFVWNLINLETLKIKKIDVPDKLNSLHSGYDIGASSNYPLGINMLSDTLVVINTEDGVKLFELK